MVIEGVRPRSRDVDEVLRCAVDEAAALLYADGAILYLLDAASGTLRWSHDAGISSASDRAWVRGLQLAVGQGMFGAAVAERHVTATDDYPNDRRFQHAPGADRVVSEVGIRSMVVAPLLDGEDPIGALGAYSARPAAFREAERGLIRALADHAAASLTNARLIEQLARHKDELQRRAEAERTLREIAARVTAIRGADEVLQRVVEESKRLLGADGAHLALMADGGDHLTPTVVADATDEPTRAWLRTMRFPVGGGINGLAAELREVVRTHDYLDDPRIPHAPEDQEVAARLGLRGMAAAPLRAAGGEVMGTLAVSYAEPRDIPEEALDLLQGLADQAAIALANARLYEELQRSEGRYRYLLQNSPDLVWSTDADGRFTFVSETSERLAGWKPKELLGKHFTSLVHPSSMEEVMRGWEAVSRDPTRGRQFRFNTLHRDGRAIPAEIHGVGIGQDGKFVGAHGAVRDIRERDQLERDLRRHAAELASAEERAHLARELHDSVTQALFSMTLTTRTIEMLIPRDPGTALEKVRELRELERDALAEMRALIFELRPGNLERDGLVQALRTHAAAVQGRTGLPISVEAGEIARLPLSLENALYRVAQEAVHNVVKHASAANVRIVVEIEDQTVRMTVADDGVGFDPALVPSAHLGLAGMRTRAELVGGRMEVTSRPGEGTVVAVIAPIEAPRDVPDDVVEAPPSD